MKLAQRNHLRVEDLVPQGLQSFNQVTQTPHAQQSELSSNLLDCRDQGQARAASSQKQEQQARGEEGEFSLQSDHSHRRPAGVGKKFRA